MSLKQTPFGKQFEVYQEAKDMVEENTIEIQDGIEQNATAHALH